MKVAVILNPKSGTAASKDDILREFAKYHVECEVIPLDGSDDIREKISAAANEYDVLAAAGGDGTISSLADMLASANGKAALGVIPTGTCNDLSRSLQIPCDMGEAVKVIVEGRTAPMDLILTENDRFIINQANGGFAGAIAKQKEKGAQGIDRWRSYLDVIRGMPTFELSLQLDEEPLNTRAISLTVANARYSGGGVPTAPEASYSDGLMDVVIIEDQDRMSLLGLIPKIAPGKHIGADGVIFRRTRRLDVEAHPEMPYSLDGEAKDEHETFFEIAPSQINLRVPVSADGE